MKIVAAGECCLDHYDGEEKPRLGGITFNFALHAAAAFPDAEVHLLSVVADKDRAAFDSKLDEFRIKHDLAPAVRTPFIGIRLDDSGERFFHSYDPGGLLDWEVSESQRQIIEEADLVVLTRYHEISPVFERLVRVPTRGRRVVDFADISGTPVSHIDQVTADRDFADVCIFGVAPHEDSLRDYLQTLAKDYAGMFLITLAEQGAMAIKDGNTYQQPAVVVPEVVDTTGAGDCFAAHFLSTWCTSDDINAALFDGCLAASRIIQRRGAS
jgi:sugar/nucleoside kinase (ribokinase family)